jgi:glyoxylase-like metal-dependent hydrolase (beta-lactamase superfamily II)
VAPGVFDGISASLVARMDFAADDHPGARRARRIVITHAHPDHVRGLAEFHRHTRTDVLITSPSRPGCAVGRWPPRPGRRPARRAARAAPDPVTPDGELRDGEVIDGSAGPRVIHTPGHSPAPR